MKARHDIFSVQLAVAIYCAWNARDLAIAWQHNRYDRYGWIVLLIWCLPLILLMFVPSRRKASEKSQSVYTAAGLLFSFIGAIGSLNFFEYVGLALIMANWMPFSWLQILWVLSSLSWMPVLGWIGSRFFLDHILMVRILLSFSASALLSYYTVFHRKQNRCMAVQK